MQRLAKRNFIFKKSNFYFILNFLYSLYGTLTNNKERTTYRGVNLKVLNGIKESVKNNKKSEAF